MQTNNAIIRTRQCAMRREMDRRGIALKAISFDSGIPYSSLVSYFPQEGGAEPAIIPASALYGLTKALPSDLLSLVLPEGWAIVQVPEQIDHDELAGLFCDYLRTKEAAHHPDSPAGRDIADCERDALNSKVVHLPIAKVAA